MRRLLLAAAATAALSSGVPPYAASDANCQAMWQKADINNDGTLSDAEAQRDLAMIRVRDRKLPADNRMDRAAVLDACKADAGLRLMAIPGLERPVVAAG
jgi:hypothetical protein